MTDQPKFIEHVDFVDLDNGHSKLVVNGETFPFVVAPDPYIELSRQGIAWLNVRILISGNGERNPWSFKSERRADKETGQA